MKADVLIVGGGILGTALAWWLSQLSEGKIVVLEEDAAVALHASSRNSGILHRPFYLDPIKRKRFADAAQRSYFFWKELAARENLPWFPCGTLDVATRPEHLSVLEKFKSWSAQNGMQPHEYAILSAEESRRLVPGINCVASFISRTDVSVDFGAFTRQLKKEAEAFGAQFLFGYSFLKMERGDSWVRVLGNPDIEAPLLINAAGGNAIDVAHAFGVGQEYTDLHFRGEYWEVAESKCGLANLNVHPVPKHLHLPFLGVHWVARADGRREVGPSVVCVAGSKTYRGFFKTPSELIGKIFEPPLRGKLRLLQNGEFLQLLLEEWHASLSKKALLDEMRALIPDLEVGDLLRPGTSGVRSTVIDQNGQFPREAIELSTPVSYHILNYNSPGASGAPAFAAGLIARLKEQGRLPHLKEFAALSHWSEFF